MLTKKVLAAAVLSLMSAIALAAVTPGDIQFNSELAFEVVQSEQHDFDSPDDYAPTLELQSIDMERSQALTIADSPILDERFSFDTVSAETSAKYEVGWRTYF